MSSYPQQLQPLRTPDRTFTTDVARYLYTQIQTVSRSILLQETTVQTLLAIKKAYWADFEADRLRMVADQYDAVLRWTKVEHKTRIEQAMKDYQAAERGLAKLYVERWKLSEKLRDEEVMAKAWEETQKEVEERRRRADTTMEPGPGSAY